jgi:hypothetical protein
VFYAARARRDAAVTHANSCGSTSNVLVPWRFAFFLAMLPKRDSCDGAV